MISHNITIKIIGTAVITEKEALLWTDGRYFLQAEKELEPSLWTLMKDRLPTTVPIEIYLADVFFLFLSFFFSFYFPFHFVFHLFFILFLLMIVFRNFLLTQELELIPQFSQEVIYYHNHQN